MGRRSTNRRSYAVSRLVHNDIDDDLKSPGIITLFGKICIMWQIKSIHCTANIIEIGQYL